MEFVSPAYDLININLIFPKDWEELALTLNRKKVNINQKDFNLLSEKLGIPQKVTQNIYQNDI